MRRDADRAGRQHLPRARLDPELSGPGVGGLIWAYLGPPELTPDLPQLGWSLVPDSHRVVARTFHECNYMQGLEGEIDTAHISFLHKWFDDAYSYRGAVTASTQFDQTPRLTVQETDYGFVYGGRRDT